MTGQKLADPILTQVAQKQYYFVFEAASTGCIGQPVANMVDGNYIF